MSRKPKRVNKVMSRQEKVIHMKKFGKLSAEQLNSVRGGKRCVVKYDTDGDGKWDQKIVYDCETGSVKKWKLR